MQSSLRPLFAAPVLGLFLLTAATAWAQPLARLAPAETVVALGATPQADVLDSLADDLRALDWGGAGATLERLLGTLADNPEFREFDEILGALRERDAMFDELAEVCPPLPDAMDAFDDVDGIFGDDFLITISVSPFNPLPAATAFARIRPDAAGAAATLQEVLVECFATDPPLMQDDVPLYVLGDGGDLPLVVTAIDDVYIAGSNPEVVRAAVRLANGSSEANLADTELWRAQERFAPGGFSLAVNTAVLADVLDGLRGMLPADPAASYLAERGVAALRTLGGVVGRVSATADGVLSEAVLAVNPDGGDPELAELLLCGRCTVSRPFVAPASSLAIHSSYLPIRELVGYAQSWLDGVGEAADETLDLRTLLRDELGFDLDRALLDWIGNNVHTVTLEAVSPDLRTLLYNPAQAVLIPVASAEQARAGLDELGTLLLPALTEIVEELDGMGPGGFDDGFLSPTAVIGSVVAVRPGSYRGIPFDRVQLGFNADMAVAFVGNTLVIASPSSAVEPIIDTFRGEPGPLDNRAYRLAVADAPGAVSGLVWSDDAALTAGLVELAELTSQPLAFGLVTVLEASAADGGPGFGVDDLGPVDLRDLTATGLEPGTIEAELTADDRGPLDGTSDLYRLTGIEAGQLVTIEMRSDVVDTYLYLIDPDGGRYLLLNDDAPDITRSELRFVAEAGRDYWLEATSFLGDEIGPYVLTVSTSTEPDVDTVEAPGFAELLDLTDLIPTALGVLVDHLGTSQGYTVIEDGGVYRRVHTQLRW